MAAKAKQAKKKKETKGQKGQGKGKPEKPKKDDTVEFSRVDLQTLLLGFMNQTPGGVTQAQHDEMNRILNVHFGEEPATLSEPKPEGEESNVQ